jgi:hypothetical protein
MISSEIAAYIASAAASGVIGNRMDSLVTTLEPVRKLHAWLQARLIDPADVESSPVTTSWVGSLGEEDRSQLGDLLRDAIGAAKGRSVQSSGGIAFGNDNYGAAIGNDNYGTVVGSQNFYSTPDTNNEWEYAKVNYGQEGDFDHLGRMKWVAYISRPDAERLDVRDHVGIEQVLNELGQEGWLLVSQQPSVGINTTDYVLKRPKRAR